MSSLDKTYRILAEHCSPSASAVLRRGAIGKDKSTRMRSYRALAQAGDPASLKWLISRFEKHREELLSAFAGSDLSRHVGHLGEAVVKQLAAKDWDVEKGLRLIAMAECLNHMPAMGCLVDLVTDHEDSRIRAAAGEATLSLATQLGHFARHRPADEKRDLDRERFRLKLGERLLASVDTFLSHRNNDLVDSFLILSHWRDPWLRNAIKDGASCQETLLRRLRISQHEAVLELLAGYIGRRKIPVALVGMLLRRQDTMFCDALLRAIGNEPSATALANLREYGLPDCLRGGESLMRSLGNDRDGALCHAYSATMPHDLETVHMILAMLQRGTNGGPQIAEACFRRLKAPSLPDWIALIEDSDDERNAMLLDGLIDCCDSDEVALAKAVQKFLHHLNVDEALPMFTRLTPEVGQRLGRVLMQTDASTIDVIRSGLRHAVLQNRLNAIAFTESLCLIDLMIEPLNEIAVRDHQIARVRAAEALGHGTGPQSEDVLKQMSESQNGSIRDAAIASLDRRGVTL